MVEKVGNIWRFADDHWVVIPTNIGWKRDGTNPMGAGIAKTAADRFEQLPLWYGLRCQKHGERTAVTPFYAGRMFMFPTKPLNMEQPWLSWQGKADLKLIARSARQLQAVLPLVRKKLPIGRVAIPLVGCGAGGLKPVQVIPLLRSVLSDDFVLVVTPD